MSSQVLQPPSPRYNEETMKLMQASIDPICKNTTHKSVYAQIWLHAYVFYILFYFFTLVTYYMQKLRASFPRF